MARTWDIAEAPPDELAPVIPFELFYDYVFDWEQNQHIGVIGPTEQGKTNLIRHLLDRRKHIAYMGIKSEDETLDDFLTDGWVRSYGWPTVRQRRPRKIVTWDEAPRRLVWPDARQWNADAEQGRVFNAMLQDVWSTGRVCVVWDDFWYLSTLLRMERDAKKMLLNARSCWSPQVIAAQRAGGNRMVELTDQPTWLFWAKETDPRNLQLLGSPRTVRRGFVENLDRFQFLVENTRSGDRYRITAPYPYKSAAARRAAA